MQLDNKFWSGALIVVMIVVAGAGTLPTLLLRPATSDAPELPAAQTAVPAEEPTAEAPGAPDSTASAAAAAEPAPVAAASVAKPAQPLTSWPTALPVAAEPPKRVGRPVAVEASATPASKAVAATANQSAFPPVQAIDAPEVAPRPAPGGDAARKAKQAQLAAAREAKRKRHVMRPPPYSIREFFAIR